MNKNVLENSTKLYCLPTASLKYKADISTWIETGFQERNKRTHQFSVQMQMCVV